MMGFVRVRKLRVMALGLAILGTSTIALAQPARTVRVGVLGLTPSDPALADAFAQGLAQLGYVDGRTVIIDHRNAGGNPERLPEIAAELARARCEVIFARGGGSLAAAKNAASGTPIVAEDCQGPWPRRPAGNAEASGQDHRVMGGQRFPLTVTEWPHVRQG